MNTRQMKCETHPEENQNWVCLEMNCERRLMCSKCAVKIHDKTHRVEELESIKQKGLLSFFPNAPAMDSAAGLLQQKSHKKSTSKNETLGLERVFSAINDRVQKSLQLHEREMDALNDEIEQPNERNASYAKVAEVENDLILSKNKGKLKENLSEAISNIHKYILRSGSQSIELRQELLQRKKVLLQNLQSKFLSILKGFFDNALVNPLCNLFENQVQVLKAKQELKVDEGHFLTFIEAKWSNEYAAIEETLMEISERLAIDINGLLAPGRMIGHQAPEVVYPAENNIFVGNVPINQLPPIGGVGGYIYPTYAGQQVQTPTHPHIQYYQVPVGHPAALPPQQVQQQQVYPPGANQGFPSGYKYTPLTPYNGPGPKGFYGEMNNNMGAENVGPNPVKKMEKGESFEESSYQQIQQQQQQQVKVSGKKALPPLTREPSGFSSSSHQKIQRQGLQIEEEKVSIFENEQVEYITPKKCSYKEEKFLSGEGSKGYLKYNTSNGAQPF